MVVGFSIHKRIEGGATSGGGLEYGRNRRFQYPQADRRGCNGSPIAFPSAIMERFSIHKRIEGGATGLKIWRGEGTTRFSIHKRIEGGATW